MLRFAAVLALALLSSAGSAAAKSALPASLASESDIRQILADRIDQQRRGVGIVVGVITPEGRKVIAHGGLDQGDPRMLGGDTVFEIGSVGKVFTALLLADMVRRGEVALADPVARYLPPQVHVPERSGRAITLQDLAAHHSGLPRLPTNFAPRDPANPYADYTLDRLYQFLSDYQLTRDAGAQYQYSNLGYGLLGHALARRAGLDYEALVLARIAAPLGLASTRVALSPQLKARLAIGHNERLEPVPNWEDTTLAGAGSLLSSVNDLLRLLSAHLDARLSPLRSAMRAMLTVRQPTDTPNVEIALGWHISRREGRELIWHNGGTGGFSSFIGFSPDTRSGVVVLANAGVDIDDIALHVMDRRYPLASLPQPAAQPDRAAGLNVQQKGTQAPAARIE
jgi:serine-type D-Ala-D-Ala carboxypeptidase/endopeptidase